MKNKKPTEAINPKPGITFCCKLHLQFIILSLTKHLRVYKNEQNNLNHHQSAKRAETRQQTPAHMQIHGLCYPGSQIISQSKELASGCMKTQQKRPGRCTINQTPRRWDAWCSNSNTLKPQNHLRMWRNQTVSEYWSSRMIRWDWRHSLRLCTEKLFCNFLWRLRWVLQETCRWYNIRTI